MIKGFVIALLIVAFGFIISIKVLHITSFNDLQRAIYTMTHNTSGDFKTIPASEVKAMVESGNVTVLDVRNADEIAATGMIKGSIHIPVTELSGRLAELDKNRTYITFCAVGGRSKKAAAILDGAGFKSIYNAQEGMNTWPYPGLIKK